MRLSRDCLIVHKILSVITSCEFENKQSFQGELKAQTLEKGILVDEVTE